MTTDEGIYKVSIEDGSLIIARSYTDGNDVLINTHYDNSIPVTYNWNVLPNTYNIRSFDRNEVEITFLESLNYVVKCRVTSPTASDSPAEGIYSIYIRDNYILTVDPDGETLMDEDGMIITYDY